MVLVDAVMRLEMELTFPTAIGDVMARIRVPKIPPDTSESFVLLD